MIDAFYPQNDDVIFRLNNAEQYALMRAEIYQFDKIRMACYRACNEEMGKLLKIKHNFVYQLYKIILLNFFCKDIVECIMWYF